MEHYSFHLRLLSLINLLYIITIIIAIIISSSIIVISIIVISIINGQNDRKYEDYVYGSC